eukprot:scaffold29738_cov129-Isochrysis_galbana.AAC.2
MLSLSLFRPNSNFCFTSTREARLSRPCSYLAGGRPAAAAHTRIQQQLRHTYTLYASKHSP